MTRTASPALFCLTSSISSLLCGSGISADLTIRGMSRIRMAIGQLPSFCDARTAARKNPGSTSVVRLMPSSTTGPWK